MKPGEAVPQPIYFTEDHGDRKAEEGIHDEAVKIYTMVAQRDHSDPFLRSRVYRKIGNCRAAQWNFSDAAAFYDHALQELETVDKNEDHWWRCWIDIHNDYCYTYHTTSQLDLLTKKIEELKQIITEKGNRKQRIKFLTTVYLAAMQRARWYMPPEEVITLCEMIKQLAREENDTAKQILGMTSLAFAHLWRRETASARKECLLALQLLATVDDDDGFVRTYTGLAYAYRMENNVLAAAEWTDKAERYARSRNNFPLLHLCKSMRAWLYIKEGQLKLAETEAKESLAVLLQVRFPFLYIALMPLLWVSVQHKNTEQMVRCAFLLLHPNAQQLPDAIGAQLKDGLDCWSQHHMETAIGHFKEAVAYADNHGYL